MYSVGDRVRKRFVGGKKEPVPTGTVVSIAGRWIHVKHDLNTGQAWASESDRFDYLEDEIEHLNPLLRIAAELGPNDRPLS